MKKTFDTLTVYSSTWCPDCRQAKKFLDENGVDYELVEIDKVEGAAELLGRKPASAAFPTSCSTASAGRGPIPRARDSTAKA